MTATTANGGDHWTIADGGRVQPNVHDPVFTSGATVSYAENGTTAVTMVTASDADMGQMIAFALTGGADVGLFTITSAGGVLTFNTAPDYEMPMDMGGNNVYEVTITATDGGTPAKMAMQTLTITVTDVANEGGGGTPADDFVLKITTTAGTNASDMDFTFYTEDTNYDIDWGDDGMFEATGVSGNQPHTFTSAGDHTIRFRNLNDVYINNQADRLKIYLDRTVGYRCLECRYE